MIFSKTNISLGNGVWHQWNLHCSGKDSSNKFIQSLDWNYDQGKSIPQILYVDSFSSINLNSLDYFCLLLSWVLLWAKMKDLHLCLKGLMRIHQSKTIHSWFQLLTANGTNLMSMAITNWMTWSWLKNNSSAIWEQMKKRLLLWIDKESMETTTVGPTRNFRLSSPLKLPHPTGPWSTALSLISIPSCLDVWQSGTELFYTCNLMILWGNDFILEQNKLQTPTMSELLAKTLVVGLWLVSEVANKRWTCNPMDACLQEPSNMNSFMLWGCITCKADLIGTKDWFIKNETGFF